MKASELIEKIKEYPDFDVEFCLFESDDSSYGASLRIFSVMVNDIGHSSKIISLGRCIENDGS